MTSLLILHQLHTSHRTKTKYFNMKSIILVALAFVAITVAVPVEEPIKTLRYQFEQQPEGNYVYGYETENGINRNEEGKLKQVLDEDNKPQDVVVVRGSYSYPGEDGKPVNINYEADEFGYRAEGDSIPKPARR